MTAIEVTDENINTILVSAKPLLLDFSAEWCGPCKMMSPIVKSIANALDGKAVVGNLDIDQKTGVETYHYNHWDQLTH